MITREVRKYIYAVSLTALSLAVLLGYVPAATAVGIVPLVTALLNLTPADAPNWLDESND